MEISTGYFRRIARRLTGSLNRSTWLPTHAPFEPGVEFRPFGNESTFRIYGPPDDGSIFGAVRATGTFEPHVVRVFERLVTGNGIVLDVGANIGVLTCVLASLAPRGKVYAFEASRTAANYLTRNIKANGLKNVEPVLKAVSDTDGAEISMHIVDEFLGGTFLSTVPVTEGRIEKTKTITLDAWAAQNKISHIDFIKMDIEGAEIFALEGAKRILSEMQPYLCVECNAIALKRFHNKSPEDSYRLLSAFYKFIYLVPDFQAAAELIRIDSLDQLLESLRYGRGNEDLLCSPRALDNATGDFEQYLAALKGESEGRQIVLNPDWQIEFEQSRYQAAPGETVLIRATIKNLSDETWANWAKNPVNLAYHIVDRTGNVLVFDGERTSLDEPLSPGSSASIELRVAAPAQKGIYSIQVSPVQEFYTWFDKACGEKITAIELEIN